VSQCHSEALAEACPEQSEGTHEILHFVQDDTSCQILHGVYPEPKSETLRGIYPERSEWTQGDTWRRVQNDKHAISLIVTQPPRGREIKWTNVHGSRLREVGRGDESVM